MSRPSRARRPRRSAPARGPHFARAHGMDGIVPYVGLSAHGTIGDRRTAALVAADGTMDWLCLPDYDGDIVLGALLDARKGGFWRLGPAELEEGRQSYSGESMLLETEWASPESRLVLREAMLWPEDRRAPEQESCRVLVRCLACVKGQAQCEFHLRPGLNFAAPASVSFAQFASGTTIQLENLTLRLWSNL